MASSRRPWLAGMLSLLVPGLGQLYAGRGTRALLAFTLVTPVELAVYLLAVLLPFGLANLLVPVALVLAIRVLVSLDGARAARGAVVPLPWFSRWYVCILAVVAAWGLNTLWASAYRTTAIQAFKIPAGSMRPTILTGDHFLAIKWCYGWREPFGGRVIIGSSRPRRGELVVFRLPEDPSRVFLKRVIALPGETVEIRKQTVLIDGVVLTEPYAQFVRPPAVEPLEDDGVASVTDNWGPQTVPAESYFVLGDNRDNSRDSRFWGFLPHELLLGRAGIVYWSRDESGAVRWERLGRWLR